MRASKGKGGSRRLQGIFWILTIPYGGWGGCSKLPNELNWIKGQVELGGQSGYRHWQLVCAFRSKVTLRGVQRAFGTEEFHAELTRSGHANDYVWKEETRVDGTQFEYGTKPILRNSKVEWESVWVSAQRGDLMLIPANIRVVSYRTLRAIGADFSVPVARVCARKAYIGPTGTGKSYRAWTEFGGNCYPKDPRSKFWYGYQGQQNVIIDEFRGGIDISHILRWTDDYPCNVETKGGSVVLLATQFIFTSNLSIDDWYKELDWATLQALKRRIQVIECNDVYESIPNINT